MSSSTPPAKLDAAQRAARRVTKASLTFGAALVSVVLASSLPAPWSLSGLVFAAITFVMGVRAIRVIREVPQVGAMQLLIGIGMAMTAFISTTLIFQAMVLPTFLTYQTCQAQAITETAVADCAAQFRSDLDQRFPWMVGLVGSP